MSCQQVPTAPAFNPYPRSVQVGEFEVAIGGGIWVAIGVLACRGCVLHKAFTVSERVAIAEAVAERLGKRQGGDRKTDQSGNISTLIDHGKTRDLAAAKAGLGSGKTLEAAM